MQEYYNRRASEYEAKYSRDDPTRLAEQGAITEQLERLFAGRKVLEVACGTGYWTQFLARVASRVVGVDASEEMLGLARTKGFDPARVQLVGGDAYRLEDVPGDFDAGVANFWFSHVPTSRLHSFLSGFHSRVGPGAVVFMVDDVNVPGVGGVVVPSEDTDDAYKVRTLADGSPHLVLKNYYSEADLRGIFGPLSRDLRVEVGSFHWWLSYTVA